MQRKTLAMLLSMLCCTGAFAQDTPAPTEETPAAPAAAPAAPEMTAEQKAMMDAYAKMGEIRAEHKRMDYFVGNWKTKNTMQMDASSPPQTSEGTASMAWILDGHYIESRMTGDMMGQPFEGRGLSGFDNLEGKYFATWADTMSTGHFVAWGTYDEATKTYTYTADMNDPMKPGTKTPVRIVEKIVDDNHFTFEWYETHDGKEAKTMTIEYTRDPAKA